jgi:uncharacterized protein YprB with RNaseH-like and TPR domain
MELEASVEHCWDIRYFSRRLSSVNAWRLFDAFKNRAVYLDIETSGGYQGLDEITVIGLYDGRNTQTFVNGDNLDRFEIAVADYDMVITFSGSAFDLPFIRRWFPNIHLPPAHVDLRFLLKQLGYTGGLKKIEKSFGLDRDDDIQGMGGYEAVLLWKDFQWGNDEALEKLIRYNTADIVNLEPLMVTACKKMKEKLFSGLTLKNPPF